MAIEIKRYSAEEFEQFVRLPEHADRRFELIGGEIVDVVSNNYSSLVAMRIGARLLVFVENRQSGYVTGADGGYVVSGERYIPDAAYISKERQPDPSHEAYNPTPPDLAVEVLSPTDEPDRMRFKIVNYLRAGTTVWVVDPEKHHIEVYAPGSAPQIVRQDGTLDGGDVLPGFTLAVKDIFPE